MIVTPCPLTCGKGQHPHRPPGNLQHVSPSGHSYVSSHITAFTSGSDTLKQTTKTLQDIGVGNTDVSPFTGILVLIVQLLSEEWPHRSRHARTMSRDQLALFFVKGVCVTVGAWQELFSVKTWGDFKERRDGGGRCLKPKTMYLHQTATSTLCATDKARSRT